jgi:transcriptional regulator of acetoin/glycerol metabolism
VQSTSIKEKKRGYPHPDEDFFGKRSDKIGSAGEKNCCRRMRYLVSYSCPGNIRELENLIRYLMVTSEDDYIEPHNIPQHVRDQKSGLEDLFNETVLSLANGANGFATDLTAMIWPELEKEYVVTILKKNNWNITWSAEDSGINRSTFSSRI